MDKEMAAHEGRMTKAVEAFQRELGSIRAGKASPALLDNIRVDYYGTPTPLKQVASVSAPEPRLLIVQPWEKNLLQRDHPGHPGQRPGAQSSGRRKRAQDPDPRAQRGTPQGDW